MRALAEHSKKKQYVAGMPGSNAPYASAAANPSSDSDGKKGFLRRSQKKQEGSKTNAPRAASSTTGGDRASKKSAARGKKSRGTEDEGIQQPPMPRASLQEDVNRSGIRPGAFSIGGSMGGGTSPQARPEPPAEGVLPTSSPAAEQANAALPLAAEVADDEQLEAQIRMRIMEEAVQADVVTDDTGDKHEDEEGDSPRRTKLIIAGLALILLVIGVVVGVTVPLTKGSSSSPDQPPTNSPTMQATTPTFAPTPPPTPAPTALTSMTIVIQLDDKPEETGWRLDCEPNPVFVPPGTYAGDNEAKITVEVEVGTGQECSFTIVDSAGNGMEEGSYYELYYGSPEGATPFASGDGSFGTEAVVPMNVDLPPTGAPTASPAPTATPAPSPSPPVPVTILIQLDSLPDETGWSLQCDGIPYANVPQRTYSVVNQLVEETFFVPDGSECRFVITDANNDGIDNGFYRIYLSDGVDERTKIAEGGGDFGASAEAKFEALALIPRTASPTSTPAPTVSFSPTMAPTQTLWELLGGSITGGRGFGDPIALSSGDGSVVAIAAGFTRVLRYDASTLNWVQLGQDIQGFPDDSFEKFISISRNGMILALGATRGVFPGSVRVFEYSGLGNSWNQLGRTIDGARDEDETLTPISLSADGSMIAIGEREGLGLVRVYRYSDSTDWLQVGQNITGVEEGAWFGNSVSLSSEGTVVAVGAPFSGANSNGSTHVFQYDDSEQVWRQLGQAIEGTVESGESGTVVSLSGLGSIVAIGTQFAEHVRVFGFQDEDDRWSQLGSDIQDGGSDDGYAFGITVSLSYNGDIVAVGKPFGGPTQVFRYETATQSWTQLGPDIDEVSGLSVSLSDDGRVVAVGDGGGQVGVFKRN